MFLFLGKDSKDQGGYQGKEPQMPAPATGGGKRWFRIICRSEFMSGLQLELRLPLKGVAGRSGVRHGGGGGTREIRASVLPGDLWGAGFRTEGSGINKTICADLAHVVAINLLPARR